MIRNSESYCRTKIHSVKIVYWFHHSFSRPCAKYAFPSFEVSWWSSEVNEVRNHLPQNLCHQHLLTLSRTFLIMNVSNQLLYCLLYFVCVCLSYFCINQCNASLITFLLLCIFFINQLFLTRCEWTEIVTN